MLQHSHKTGRMQDAKELVMFATKTHWDQVTRNKYFLHVWPRWLRGRSTLENAECISMLCSERMMRPDQAGSRHLRGDEYHDEITDEKLEKQNVVETREENLTTTCRARKHLVRSGKRPIGIKLVDVGNTDGRYRCR